MTAAKQVALVTGANRGLGFEVSRQLAQQGFTVLMGARDLAKGAVAAQQLQAEGLSVLPVLVDLHAAATFEALATWIAAEYGHLDVLVNNGGVALDIPYNATTMPMSLLRETFEVNFFAQVELTQKLLPLIQKSPAGRIVNQSSIFSSLTLQSDPQMKMLQPLAYNASKAAINSFTVHLAAALKDTPIKVNAAHPGQVLTDMNPYGTLTPPEGAKTTVVLATLPADGPTGGFFHQGEPLPW